MCIFVLVKNIIPYLFPKHNFTADLLHSSTQLPAELFHASCSDCSRASDTLVVGRPGEAWSFKTELNFSGRQPPAPIFASATSMDVYSLVLDLSTNRKHLKWICPLLLLLESALCALIIWKIPCTSSNVPSTRFSEPY